VITIKESNQADEDWNTRLVQSKLATVYQSQEYAEHILHEGRKPHFLQFLDDKSIKGQLLVQTTKRFRNNTIKSKILKNISAIKQVYCYWAYGPIIFDKKFSHEIYSTLGKFLKEKKFVASGWQNPLCTNGIKDPDDYFQLKPWSTFIIDLTQTKQKIFDSIDNHSGRKNIRRSLARGVIVEPIDDDNYRKYAELRALEQNLNLTSDELEDRIEWWRSAKRLGYSGFLALKNKKPIGGILFSSFGKHILEVGVVRSREDTVNHFYSQDLLKWKIIEWGTENKMLYYNLAGFNPKPQSSKEEGIFRYKKKWGGQRYDFSRLFLK
jgi:lipid II:glycine glycyltransferase (peptidoglycan interpeptide bridge formation enzyme)